MLSQVLETGSKVCCFFFPCLCAVVLDGFVLISLHLKMKGTLSTSPISHLILGMRTRSDSITSYIHHFCHPSSPACHTTFVIIFLRFFCVISYTWFVQIRHYSLFESLEQCVINIPVLSSVTECFCLVTSYTTGGFPVLPKP